MDIQILMGMVGDCASLVSERLALDRKSRELKTKEDDLKARIIQQMHLLGLTSIGGTTGAQATIKTSVEPIASDWSAVLQYIRETGSTDLLQKRLTASAVRLRWEDGVQIPGIDRYEKTDLVIS